MTVLAAEWIKLRSLRSTWVVLAIALGAVPLALLLAWWAAGLYDAAPPARRPSARVAELEDVVLIVPQLGVGVLGVLAMTSEYASGLVASTFAAVPRRWPVLAAKAAAVASCGLVVGQAVMFAAAYGTRAVIGERFQDLTPVSGKVTLLVASGVSVAVFGLLGLGLGAILRHAAAAVAILVGVLYVVPIVVARFPEPWGRRLGSLMFGGLPGQIAGADMTNSVFGALLPPWAATVALALYAGVPLLAGAWAMRLRDA
ncbi:hypothetical protein [Thermoactinospora rubra]|uniref:hypothetical protein n=1 Tax=Thermoactinospora rubra TaxID=1088767 RepID=UPI000A1162E5|nr:hypothetical protein [Thermoactinospora rubra]